MQNIIAPLEQIIAQKVILKKLTSEHLPALRQTLRKEADRLIDFKMRHYKTEPKVRGFIERSMEDWKNMGAFSWAILRKDTETFSGLIYADKGHPENDMVELGVWLKEADEGNGIAAEATALVCAQLPQCGVEIAQVYFRVENTGSIKLFQKLGFERSVLYSSPTHYRFTKNLIAAATSLAPQRNAATPLSHSLTA